MSFDWKKHLDEILATGPGVSAPRSSSTGEIPGGFDELKNHKIETKHTDTIDRVIGTLNAVKDSYHANGTTPLRTGHGHDPHLMAQDLAATVLADQGVVPRFANGGRHYLHAADSTPDGSLLRLHYASKAPSEKGHIFTMRPDGSLKHNGETRHNTHGPYSSPFKAVEN